jgi:hypothetical protein
MQGPDAASTQLHGGSCWLESALARWYLERRETQEDHDRGGGTEASHRPLAPGDGRGNPSRCHIAPFNSRNNKPAHSTGSSQKTAANVVVGSKVCSDRLRSSTWGIGHLHWLAHIGDSARPRRFLHSFSVVRGLSMEPGMLLRYGIRSTAGFHPAAELVALSRPLAHPCGRNGMKSGMASSSIFSSIAIVPSFSSEISICRSKSAGL